MSGHIAADSFDNFLGYLVGTLLEIASLISLGFTILNK